MKPEGKTRERCAAICIVLLALALRTGYTSLALRIDPFLLADPLLGDAASYDLLARNLAAGNGYSMNPPAPDIFWPPLYPLFLAAIYRAIGYYPFTARLIQVVLGSLAPLCIYLLARGLFERRTAILAGLGLAVYPPLIYFGAWLIADGLYVTLLSVVLLLMMRLQSQPSLLHSLVLGLLLGLAVLLKPVTLFMLPLVALWFLVSLQPVKFRRRLGLGICAALSLAAALTPWILRNYRETGEFVLVSINGGYTFYGANNPDAFGGHAEEFPPRIAGLTAIEQDREYYRRGLTWIRENPGDYLSLVMAKYRRLFSPLSVASQPEDYPLPQAGIVRIGYGLFLLLAFAGLAVALRRAGRTGLLLVPILAVLASAAVFYGDTRYSLPMAPPLVTGAAFAIHEGLATLAKWRRRMP